MSKTAQPQVITPTAKPALVLVHGFRGSPIGLKGIAQDLRTAGYEVHVPAIPPFAGAGALDSYTPEAYARFLKDYIDQHQLNQPVLIGHSMGSVIISALATRRPELINNKLILMSPISSKPAKPFALISPLSAYLPRKLVDYITTRFLFVPHDHQLFQKTMAITHACTADYPPSTAAAAAAAKFAAQYSIADFLPTSQKVLIIAGDKDRLIKKHHTKALAERLQAETKFIPKSGHLHNYEQPHQTAELILDFLQS